MAGDNTKETNKINEDNEEIYKILVIEKDHTVLEAMVRLLGDYCWVYQADTAEMGMELLQLHSDEIAMAIIDAQMAVQNDCSFWKDKNLNACTKDIPVLVLAESGTDEEEKLCLKCGAADVMTKPFHSERFLVRTRNVIRLYKMLRDMKEMERDDLTGLYTKQAFIRHGEEWMASEPDSQFGIMGMDIENFKMTNDQYGEEKCDEFLAYIGKNIGKDFPNSLVGRFGGDQFVMMFPLNGKHNQVSIGEVRKRLFEKAPIQHQVAKFGFYFPIDKQLPMIRCCDRAFLAIRSIKGIYDKDFAFYAEEMQQKLLDEQRILDSMEAALAEEQFKVYYQPKHDTMTGKISGAEALVRWIHPEYGFMSPGQFIPLFEKNGFITRLDEYVLNRVCKDINRWWMQRLPQVPISVNVSRRDYFEAGWIDRQIKSIESFGIDPSWIHMEVTESLYAENAELIIEQIKKVQEKGFLIEMDDFGAGYSSLGMLATFPFDVIKLDISFVRKIERNEIVIENIIKLAHRMGFKTVAEGAETEKQYLTLRKLGCDFIQGYYFSKPLPVEEFECYVAEKSCIDENSYNDSVVSRKWTDITGELEIKNAILDCVDTLVLDGDDKNRINKLLGLVGKFYGADRGYIVEIDEGGETISNTYEWCNAGIVPEIDFLQKLDIALVDGWFKAFEERNEFYLPSVDAIKDTEPDLYEVLKPQNIINLVTAPLRQKGELVGFIGVDNPTVHTDALEMIKTLSSFIINELERIRYVAELEEASFRDAMTGLGNRRAMYREIDSIESDPARNSKPIGIVYVDVNGLKTTNDREGHEAGDRLVMSIVELIKSVFQRATVYRLGGDEFVVFSYDNFEQEFNAKVQYLSRRFSDVQSAALGTVWLEQAQNLDKNIDIADQRMYADKSNFYEMKSHNRRKEFSAGDETVYHMMRQVAESLPGGFFAYRADEEERILFINKEILRLYGCETEEEFRDFTGNSFRGMIFKDDYDMVQSGLGNQVKNHNDLDYVEYRIQRRDGGIRKVRDYGRFIHSEKYGDLFYVFVNET